MILIEVHDDAPLDTESKDPPAVHDQSNLLIPKSFSYLSAISSDDGVVIKKTEKVITY